MKHRVRVIPKEEILANRSNAYEFIDFDKKEKEENFKVWDELFGILAWKFIPTKSGDMFLDSEKVFEELKNKFKLEKI